jgi:exodeoxyribonuclease VII small subunit
MAKPKKQNLTQAFKELETIVSEFENQEVDLEKSIPKFKQGLKLAKYLKKRLSEIENEIEEIKDSFKEEEVNKRVEPKTGDIEF